MSDAQIPALEAFVEPNRELYKKVFIIGGILFLLSLGAAIWGWLFYDEYTVVVEEVMTGEISRVGPASIALSWGGGFAIVIPIMYGLMWFSIDWKNPSMGVNSTGLFMNKEGFKKAFLRWDEFERIERKGSNEIRLYMKSPESVIARQPAATRALLKQTYVTERSAITITAESPEDKEQKMVDLIAKYTSAN